MLDDVIPYSVDSVEGSYGRGPEGEVSTVISYDGMYYYEKPEYSKFLGENFSELRRYVISVIKLEGLAVRTELAMKQ